MCDLFVSRLNLEVQLLCCSLLILSHTIPVKLKVQLVTLVTLSLVLLVLILSVVTYTIVYSMSLVHVCDG